MTRFYDIDTANATLPEVEAIVTLLAEQRDDLVHLRDVVLARSSGADGGGSPDADPDPMTDEELRLVRLRMQGLIDQMQAGVARIDDLGITLRDIPSGLLDFPALVAGRQVWLCWRIGEPKVDHWHELDTGFGSRRPLAELE